MSTKREDTSDATFGDHAGNKDQEEILEEGPRRKTRTKKLTAQESQLQLLQETVEQLKAQIGFLTLRQGSQCTAEGSLVENKLIKLAKSRLRFDGKDVYGSIDTWNHFFLLYNVNSDYEKFFAVEQLLPVHVQKAMSNDETLETSYKWLVSYLKARYDPKFLCYEMSYRSLTKATNIGELEDLATEAANCPKEHIVKHFMLQTCSYQQRKKMQPFLLLPMREFKFKLKMVSQEENDRFHGNFSGNTHNRFNGNFSRNARDRFNGNPADNSRRVSAIQADEHISRERGIGPFPEAYEEGIRERVGSDQEEGNRPAMPVVREFKRSAQSGNGMA